MANPKPTQEYVEQQCTHAEWLAIQARNAELRGDRSKANELRDEFDGIYNRLEALLGYSGS